MALQQLTKAITSLSESVSNFNVGAISIADCKPLQEQIADIREILKAQAAHSLLVAAKHNSRSFEDKTQEEISSHVSLLHDEVANLQIASIEINLCLASCCCMDIMYKDDAGPEYKKQLQNCMRKLFSLNDTLLTLHTSIMKTLKEELELQIDGPKMLLEYRKFLKEQEEYRDKKLKETNPQISENKKKLELRIMKINMIKGLITNMIATATELVIGNPFLLEMLKKHRDRINIETIIEMARNQESSDSI